jgi:tight adherence protein B
MYVGDTAVNNVTLAIGLIFLAVLAVVGAFSFIVFGNNESKIAAKRLENLRDRFATSADAVAQAHMRKILAKQNSKLDTAFGRLVPRPVELKKRLERTGRGWTVGQYGIGSAVLGLIVALALAIFAHAPLALALLVGVGAAAGIPHLAVSILMGGRSKKFNLLFPNAIDLMVRGLRSGLPITESLGIVSREIPNPVGLEFRMINDKIRIGKTMDQALNEAALRINTPEFSFFIITLAIQRETGGNLAETLMNLSDILRKRVQLKLKIAAMSSEAKASAYIVGALPFIMFGILNFANPSYMGGFFTDTRLMLTGAGALFWMGIGVFIMAKMINFEI